MKVYLQYPWKVSDSQYYKNLIKYPPRNVEYIKTKSSVGIITNKRSFFLSNALKKMIRYLPDKLNLPIANAHMTCADSKYDLIHCAHCLSKNSTPWVLDFEAPWQIWVSGRNTSLGKKKVLKYLVNKNCKKIIAWTECAKSEILKIYPQLKNKTVVITHALPAPKKYKITHQGINLLFISRYFYAKGGLEALEVFDFITKKYPNVRATLISDIPKELFQKYSTDNRLTLSNLVPYEKLVSEIYPKTDILVYPGFSDTFGFAIPEAFSFGIPVISVEGYARRELIDSKSGFVVDSPKIKWNGDTPIIENRDNLIKDLINKTEMLIKNPQLRKKMSLYNRNLVVNGRFSLKERNKLLQKVYSESIIK